MANLNFNTQDTRRMPLRQSPAKFNSSDIRQGVFEVSDGDRPWVVNYPYKYLPVMFKDTSTEDYVAINKGRIVSLITNQNTVTAPSGGIPTISASGKIYVYDDATSSTSSIQSVNIDSSFFGYDDSVCSLVVPCNGGTTSTFTYTQLDVDAATFMPNGAIATVGQTFTLPANLPVGVLTADVYQDIRGRTINYQMWDVSGILCDWFIEVPYVNTAGSLSITVGTTPATAVYNAIYGKHAFLQFAVAANAGMMIESDLYGQYKLNTTTIDPSKVIGKLITTDSRYPKGMLELVDTYPGSQTSGTETGGLPAHLYKFVRATLAAASKSYGISDCVNAVQNGNFGVARIQLQV